MKILFTGAGGMLASDFIAYLAELGSHESIAIDRNQMDITDKERVKATLEEHLPDVVIHTAAQTNVDLCEEKPDMAYKINTEGTANVAEFCGKLGGVMVYTSSCGLFGDEVRPYSEEDPVVQKHTYAKSKYKGEEKVKELCSKYFIVRPGWLFGGSIEHAKNFVYTRYKEALTKDRMESANDKFGSPTYTLHLAKKIIELLATDYYDIFHITNQGQASRYDYVREIVEAFSLETEVIPVNSSKFLRPAPVPDCEVLENLNLKRYGFNLLPTWQEALKEYVEKIRVEIGKN
jgi:dTDP-4-dehydrorhamnose reductase